MFVISSQSVRQLKVNIIKQLEGQYMPYTAYA